MPFPVISVENISRSFDKNVIFEKCSVSIDKGSVFGLVGLNGSGKTTFIRMLLGLLRPAKGGISVLGHDPWKHETEYFKQLGVILDHDGFTGNLNVAENLSLFADAKGMGPRQVGAYVEEYWQSTFLYEEYFAAKKKVKFLSRGQKMQCAICRAFLSWPEVYFLDEPTVALDVDAIDHFYSLVKNARDRGATVLISSHQLAAIEDLCDTVGMLRNRNVTIVKSSGSAGGTASWMVICAGDGRFGKIIERVCGFPAVFRDSAWHFEVREPKIAIPEIVKQLVSDGCSIFGVGAHAGSLRDRIKDSRPSAEGAL
jgi:ABC-type multidrug transport system ATPase subunit